jgi:hypothetical protein
MRTPTVILRKGRDRRIVDVHDYALQIASWAAKGWKRESETSGATSDAQETARRQQAAIEHQRTLTREPPKDQAQRAIRLGTPVSKDHSHG